MPVDTHSARRIARQLDRRLPPDERAQLITDLANVEDDAPLLEDFADASSVQRDLEEQDAAARRAAPRRSARRPRRRRSRSRPWCVPTPVTRPLGETLEGAQVLEEHKDAPRLGFLLWASLRDARVWAGVAPERRGGMFDPGAADRRLAELDEAGVEPALQVPLATLVALLANPAHVQPSVVALVCIEISRWARDRGATATAAAFAQTAALAEPGNPVPALTVGALLRTSPHAHEVARAATWLRLAISLGRKNREWLPYTQAYVELAALYVSREDSAKAARLYFQAVRSARRHGFGAVRAAAMHGLMRLGVGAGELEEAEKFGSKAARGYGKEHALRAAVMHDLAALWVQAGEYERAVPVLVSQLEIRHDPRERALTLAILAHAYAGQGEGFRTDYQEAWSGAWSIINRPGSADENHARTLLQLATAAHALKDWTRMDMAVQLQAGEPRHADRRVAAQIAELLTFGRPGPGVEA